MADLTSTLVAANYRKVTTGTNQQGASLKFYEIDFGVDIRQADGANEVTYLVYQLVAQLGRSVTLIGTPGNPVYNQAGSAIGAGQGLRFAVEVAGGSTESIDDTANHGYVRTVSVVDPNVNYIDGSGVEQNGTLSAALQYLLSQYTAFAYTTDAGASSTLNLSGTTVSAFDF